MRSGAVWWRLAVDVGTSNTAAAVQIGTDPPRPVRLSDQADQMPSGVLAGPDGLVVGAEAYRSARLDPASFEACPKRRVGEGSLQLGVREVPVTAAIAAILWQVAVRAGRVTGGTPPAEVVLTHPEQWQANRRQVLVDAARAAGLTGALRLVSEPVAAASYYATRVAVPPGALVAVFDFGGGTCDVAVLRATPAAAPGGPPAPGFTVLAAEGIDPLGGEDLDALLAQWTRRQLAEGGHTELLGALDAPGGLADRLTFRDQVRGAKQALTDYESTQIPVAAGGRQATVTITAAEFDALIAEPIEAAVELTRRTLARAGVAGGDLHALYLTGGSSHLRLVQRRLTDLIGRPPATLEDPKLVVAIGALAGPAPVPPPVVEKPAEAAPVPWWRRPAALGAGALALLVAAVATIVALNVGGERKPKDETAGGSGGTTQQQPFTGPASPSATGPSPASTPAAPSTPGCGTLPADECALAARLPTDFADQASCERRDTLGPSQVALVRCLVPAASKVGRNPAVEVFATKFASQRAMDDTIRGLATRFQVPERQQACFDGQGPGFGQWKRNAGTDARGQILCYATDGSARVFWSYDGDNILVGAVATGPDVPAVVTWFTTPQFSTDLR